MLVNSSWQVGPRAVQLGRTDDLVDAISMLTRFDFLGIKVGERYAGNLSHFNAFDSYYKFTALLSDYGYEYMVRYTLQK